jgi:hypothetical protein
VAAKTEREAFDTFVGYLRETLSCVTSKYLSARNDSPNVYKILFEPYPKLETTDNSPVYISIVQHILTVPHHIEEKRFKAKTKFYSYRLLRHQTDDTQEILDYHWHPDGTAVRYPHLHIRSIPRTHFPTSRVCLEDFVLLLIKYYKVKSPLKYAEWKGILHKNKSAFEKYATWKIHH